MSDSCPPQTSFVFHRSYFDVIKEMDTPEERLAAFETLCQMAFLGEEAYDLPEGQPGEKKSPKLHAIRNIYFQSRDFIWQKNKPKKDPRELHDIRVAAGKKGGRPRKCSLMSDSMADCASTPDVQPIESSETAEIAPASHSGEKDGKPPKDGFSDVLPSHNSRATENPITDSGVLESPFMKTILSPEDLLAWINKNWVWNSRYIRDEGFIQWAFSRLVATGWREIKTNRPITNIHNTLSYLQAAYPKHLLNEKRRQEQEREELYKGSNDTSSGEMLSAEERDEICRKRMKAENAEPYE